MTLKPNRHLLEERRIWYSKQAKEKGWTVDLRNLDVLDTVNTHALEYADCPCLSCYQKSHPEEEKARAWESVRVLVKEGFGIDYPTYDAIAHPALSLQLQQILSHEEKLLFTQTTIPVCDAAAEEATELIANAQQLDEKTMQRLFVLLRGMSEFEYDEDAALNFSQLVKAYKQGDKTLQRLAAEEAVSLQVGVMHGCQK
ncbi:hypothetical protein AV274_4216 [Blastocystis sp. ATCC 50177/Nand II]|uniref:Uncharacterized protein n=1 Tax=Blastocystis sp. subtype 1 (strain ATCC 50177 / NandII) TaxID=478820 RepID=A0A196SAU9_BLAHN|nr:hypothetical protein AV274_4216 [Blastocystis sp. ATCC 50177/Nand II]